MAHDTTIPPKCARDSPPSPRVVGPRGQPGRLMRGRGRSALSGADRQVSTQWLPDTPSNRHLTVVWFRLLVDEHGKPLFTLQELATIVGSANRQAASQHLEDFRQCGEDMRAFVLRKRKVDAAVVEGVLPSCCRRPWPARRSWCPASMRGWAATI